MTNFHAGNSSVGKFLHSIQLVERKFHVSGVYTVIFNKAFLVHVCRCMLLGGDDVQNSV